MNWPGPILPFGPWPVNVMRRTSSSIGPWSVWMGLASSAFVTFTLHPIFGS
jgi:hypothetical protein